jgi:high-mobility group nucleosome-binding domain-containing protein 1
MGKDKDSGKKVQIKGKRGAKANRLKWLTSKLQICLQKMETEHQSPASEEEKEAKSD